MLARLDADHDGTISRDEFLARPEKLFARLDKNGDGKLDPSEIAAAQDQMHARMEGRHHWQGDRREARDDDDHDGWQGRHGHGWRHHGDDQGRSADRDDEHHGWRHGDRREAGEQPHRGAFLRQMLRRADTDHDGALSRAEFDTASDAVFARLDLNHDGNITSDEAERAAEAMRARHGRHDGGDR
jgi:Ca2+-binding EF-hand superfamily protein